MADSPPSSFWTSYLDGHVTLGLHGAFDTYGMTVKHLVMPTVGGESGLSIFGASYAFFPCSAPQPLQGKLLATYGNELVLQQTSGVGCDAGGWSYDAIAPDPLTGIRAYPRLPPGGMSHFTVAATITDDPGVSFLDTPVLKISPDGSKVALGIGLNFTDYYVMVFPASLLTANNATSLMQNSGVWKSPMIYGMTSVAWVTDNLLAINRVEGSNSAIDMIAPGAAAFTPIMTVPGYSGTVAVDQDGNLITGIGYLAGRTGELRVAPESRWEPVLHGQRGPLDFDADATLLATGMGSAESLDVDSEGNVCVSGTDMSVGNYGAAYLLRNDCIASVLAGGPPVQASNPQVCRTFTPDPVRDDYSMIIFANPAAHALCVVWIPDEQYPGEYFLSDTTPIMTSYTAEP